MSRLAQLDALCIFHHVVIWGIERGEIFKDDKDRDNLIERLGVLLPKTKSELAKIFDQSPSTISYTVEQEKNISEKGEFEILPSLLNN